MIHQVADHRIRRFVRRLAANIHRDFGTFWNLVRIADAREIRNFPYPCLGVVPFYISNFANFRGRGYLDLDEITCMLYVFPHVSAGCGVGRDERADRHAPVFRDFTGDVSHARQVQFPVRP